MSEPQVSSASPVLVADLDGTLCKTDTLHEAVLRLVASDPLQIARLPGWIARGKAEMKAAIADKVVLNASELPLNEAVVETLRTAREQGRRTVLVSAADHRQVTAIAEATELFDEAYGTAEGRNLKGDTKAAFLTEHYGGKGFDYIGDAKADLPVWHAANAAITVGAGSSLRRAAETANSNVTHIDPPNGTARAILKAMRPHQWSKNVLLFLPLLAAHDLSLLPQVILGFLAFCLTASSVYVINDLLDLSADRAHPRKRLRPFASGALTATQGLGLAGCLMLAALILGIATGNIGFLVVLGAYFLATFAYSLWLKRKLIIDVLMLGGLYTIRIVAGGAAGAIDLSPWMLGFSMFVFLALAAVKRQAELMDQVETGRTSSGRAYEVDDLPILRGISLSASQASVLVLALYISSGDVRALYAFPSLLWLICPLLLYWLLRMVMKTHRGQMTDDPIVFAATDRISAIVVLLCLALGIVAAVWPYNVPVI
ncbi:MAG: UbiA family prenyltransferase [Paracoccaceae bacterium]|nr:UbiA family prenyltransferase [Paracoccaceae bacterium]